MTIENYKRAVALTWIMVCPGTDTATLLKVQVEMAALRELRARGLVTQLNGCYYATVRAFARSRRASLWEVTQ